MSDPVQAMRARYMWEQIKADLRIAMPELSNGDVTICLNAVLWHVFGVGDDVETLRREHLKSDRVHDETCGACGFLDSGVYLKRTGRYLSDDMKNAVKKG